MTSEKSIENYKLIKLLSSFSLLEWKRFGRFVQSPYHNSNQHIVGLYIVLKKAFPFDINKNLEQERIYKKVFGIVPFKLSKFQNLCSDLYELATDFIVDIHLKKEKQQKKKLVVEALSRRNYELFKGASQQLIKEVETQDYFLDADDFLLLYQLNDKLFHHIERDKYTIQKEEFENSWKYLNAFYQHIEVAFKAENRGSQNFLNQNIDSTNTPNNQLTELFHRVLNLHKSKESSVYFELKRDVLKHWRKLKTQHKTDLLVHLLNFSFTEELLQNEFGSKEALNLYKIGIEDKLFIINGKMRDIEFINISILGFKSKKEDWTINFIETHQQYLSEEVKDFLVPLVLAYNANSKKDYQKVIYLLSKVNPTNNLLYLEKIKSLLIRAYFEGVIKGDSAYLIPLNYEMDSLRKMLKRNNKLSKIKTNARINFLNLTKSLLKLHFDNPLDANQIKAFELLLANTKPLLLGDWLREKLLELKNATSI